MTAAICDYLRETAQPLPVTPADYVRVIFRSLAARYAEIVTSLRRLTDVDIQRLHVIGGGSRNQYLMQFTADALQLPVIAGPQEGTALGNALVQARAAGLVASLAESRAIIARSVELKTYLPSQIPLPPVPYDATLSHPQIPPNEEPRLENPLLGIPLPPPLAHRPP